MAADPSDPQVKKTDLWKADPRRLIEVEGFNLRDYDDPDVIAQIEAADAYTNGRYVPPLIVWVDDKGHISPVEGYLPPRCLVEHPARQRSALCRMRELQGQRCRAHRGLRWYFR